MLLVGEGKLLHTLCANIEVFLLRRHIVGHEVLVVVARLPLMFLMSGRVPEEVAILSA